ncbi:MULTISPECIES: hypothetical protein [unclassified Lentimonas]|uniref:hypothetical protein n=1 Tax=unclassified Lentimonas TaxID=2630993 RepID=UPI0013258E53|nr:MULTISPECIES: hypothetical protein [unclassified Lentimonas]CAA6689913.1 Unannotated [Lentimonas sp. CC10]CAA6690956.1 Unannotated [Lentimonas sp. CC19]CAA7069395.1 Unannotated [Lentimonas sp. CC11]
MKNFPIVVALILLLAAFTGCVSIKTQSKIEPIHMTLDVNLKVELQQELSDAFKEIDAASTSVTTHN